jgi:hypothetical protein
MTSLRNIIRPIVPTNEFVGIGGLQDRLKGIGQKIDAFSISVDATFGTSKASAMETKQTETLTDIATKYNTYKTFASYSINANGDATPTVSWFGTS